MEITNPYLLAALGTGFTFLMTTLGAAMVFFFRKDIKANVQSIFLGFAAGVMIAASVWSLLIPAMEQAEELGMIPWLPAAGGFILGGIFLFGLDHALPHLHPGSEKPEGPTSSLKRTTLLVFAELPTNMTYPQLQPKMALYAENVGKWKKEKGTP